jgi:predicted acyltransferase
VKKDKAQAQEPKEAKQEPKAPLVVLQSVKDVLSGLLAANLLADKPVRLRVKSLLADVTLTLGK